MRKGYVSFFYTLSISISIAELSRSSGVVAVAVVYRSGPSSPVNLHILYGFKTRFLRTGYSRFEISLPPEHGFLGYYIHAHAYAAQNVLFRFPCSADPRRDEDEIFTLSIPRYLITYSSPKWV